jgi:hypothetical protein
VFFSASSRNFATSCHGPFSLAHVKIDQPVDNLTTDTFDGSAAKVSRSTKATTIPPELENGNVEKYVVQSSKSREEAYRTMCCRFTEAALDASRGSRNQFGLNT